MIRSLRTQVALLVAIVIVVTLAAVGFAFVGVTRTQVGQYFINQRVGEVQESKQHAERLFREAGRAGV
ncbi:MAG: hypothetical protein ACSLFQ_17260, partial [Thermoanaerobaculia bacterium]